ncbi:non-canonical purine NTP pyrophosphatase [Haloferax sp. Atlit-6N]|uniref:non-canonical purine NTP pyrophosphatase n=1 Tax=Haloferax sp. Atlit-6N TaxID=2077205 RepID=UPI0011C01D0E|nr:non-canonical purine NTP pyrophosphatase [Haloferax sp. Atlit-6N]
MSEDSILLPLITSSSRKFDHFRYLSYRNKLEEEHGVELVCVPLEYKEIQSDDMELLLSEAIKRNVFDEIRDTFFLIEQTSVFFDAMDGQGPGQYFKKWWNTKSEEDLKLKFSQSNGATIESGLALNIPNHGPLILTNRQRGKINLDGKIREENERFSWLSADDFNLYFTPNGANKVYNEMPIKDFLKYDFRRPIFDQVCQRMGEYAAVINSGVSKDRIKTILEFATRETIRKDSNCFELVAEDSKQTQIDDSRFL